MLDVMSTLHRLSVLVPAEGKYHQSCHSNYQIPRNKIHDLPVGQARASVYGCLIEDLLLSLFGNFQEVTSTGNCLLILDVHVPHC